MRKPYWLNRLLRKLNGKKEIKYKPGIYSRIEIVTFPERKPEFQSFVIKIPRGGEVDDVSMKEVIDQMKQETKPIGDGDNRKRYKGVCPVCGKENWICKSIAMEMGINTGHGACLGCKTFLHITFNPERQEMDLEKFEDYQGSKKARDDVDKIAGNLGYGGQDNENL